MQVPSAKAVLIVYRGANPPNKASDHQPILIQSHNMHGPIWRSSANPDLTALGTGI